MKASSRLENLRRQMFIEYMCKDYLQEFAEITEQVRQLENKVAIKYYTSTGERISEAVIKSRYSQSLRKKYDYGTPRCEGCGAPATCSAHIIAKARLKQLHKTELIYDQKAYFPSCYACNLAIENPKGGAWKELKNVDYCMEFIEKHDPELRSKFIL